MCHWAVLDQARMLEHQLIETLFADQHSRSDSWDVNISFNQSRSQSSELSGNAKEEGLKII